MKRGKKKLYQKQIKSSISKSKNKKLNKKPKKKSSKFKFRNIENNLSDYNSNIDLSNFQETDKYGNSNENKYNNLSSVLSTKADGSVFQAHDTNCYIGSLTALLKSIEKDKAINIAQFLKLREYEKGTIGMYKNELLQVGEKYGLLENPHFDNYILINDYKQLKQYVRQHHEDGYGGFYSINNPGESISHGVIIGFDKDGRFLLIDRQNNFITKKYGYFFYEHEVYNKYWQSYNNNAPIMITTIKFGDIIKKLNELNIKKAMHIDNGNDE